METNLSSVPFGEGGSATKVEVKKTKKRRKDRSSTFCLEEEDSREIESWEYPDEISIESSVVSSLTGIRPPHNSEKSSRNEEHSSEPIEDLDTESGGQNVSDPDTSLAESIGEACDRKLLNGRFNSILGCPIEKNKPTTLGTSKETTMNPHFHIEKKHVFLFFGTLVVVIIISIVIAIVTSGNTSLDMQPKGETHNDAKSTLTPREHTLVDLFRTVSSYGLDEENSAQYLAREWILHSDLLKLTPSETISSKRVIQRYVLAVFYYSTGGPKTWKHNNWLEGDECSNMFWTGISCNDDNIVRAIAFDNAGLQGSLPNEIGALTMLENLVIKNHPLLSGPIPAGIGRLQSLGQLGLYNNAHTGEIPGELYLATNLNYINFQNNELEGELAVQIEQMRNLERFIIFNNKFNGKVPIRQFARTGIKFLGLSNNKFTGSIPEQISNLRLLEYLYMDSNDFTGSIPPNIGRLSSMVSLNLDNNTFTGSIPYEIGNMEQLEYASLQGNYITGSIPSNFLSLSKLRVINLGSNDLSGEIPHFPPDSNLTRLHLFQNRLRGTLPESLGNLKRLEVLFLSSNNFEGSLEASLSGFKNNLEGLYLSENNFTGFIPSSLCSMVHLKALFLDTNDFIGTLPSCIASLHNLRQMFLFSNRLTGSLPASLGGFKKMSQLGLENNDFEGKVPDSVCSNKDVAIDVWADCGGQIPSVQCSCCSTCCPSSTCSFESY